MPLNAGPGRRPARPAASLCTQHASTPGIEARRRSHFPIDVQHAHLHNVSRVPVESPMDCTGDAGPDGQAQCAPHAGTTRRPLSAQTGPLCGHNSTTRQDRRLLLRPRRNGGCPKKIRAPKNAETCGCPLKSVGKRGSKLAFNSILLWPAHRNTSPQSTSVNVCELFRPLLSSMANAPL